ncbi:MAG TPA: hypothetical protein V6D33_01700 [Cyanophyceae cyanobacterium]
MMSSCYNPLPLEEHTAAPVLIYAYEGGWVPIRFSSLGEAINLYHNALLHGVEIFVFPSAPGFTDNWHWM